MQLLQAQSITSKCCQLVSSSVMHFCLPVLSLLQSFAGIAHWPTAYKGLGQWLTLTMFELQVHAHSNWSDVVKKQGPSQETGSCRCP